MNQINHDTAQIHIKPYMLMIKANKHISNANLRKI